MSSVVDKALIKQIDARLKKMLADNMALNKKLQIKLSAKGRSSAEFKIIDDGHVRGRVLHKLVGYNEQWMTCDRFLVVTPERWIWIDEDDMPISAGEVHPYGQVHWEAECPKVKHP